MASLGLDNFLFAALINWLSGCWAIWPAGSGVPDTGTFEKTHTIIQTHWS